LGLAPQASENLSSEFLESSWDGYAGNGYAKVKVVAQ
jgi:hypothetical protein